MSLGERLNRQLALGGEMTPCSGSSSSDTRSPFRLIFVKLKLLRLTLPISIYWRTLARCRFFLYVFFSINWRYELDAFGRST